VPHDQNSWPKRVETETINIKIVQQVGITNVCVDIIVLFSVAGMWQMCDLLHLA
jgi:hypothetical protein